MTSKGSTAERGYSGEHARLRRKWTPTVDAGQAHCTETICAYNTRWIPPGTAWDLAHDRANGGYRGPAHRKCNRAEGARWGNQVRGHRVRRVGQPPRQPRHW
jgi:hypothetical protein